MTTGDPMGFCSLCGQTYYMANGHSCTVRMGGWPSWPGPNTYQAIPSPGWQCPQCKRIYSPLTAECHACNNSAVVPTLSSLKEWSDKFKAKVGVLGLPARIANSIKHAALAEDEKYVKGKWEKCEPYIRGAEIFAPYGKLLEFDEWCLWMLENQDAWHLRNVGDSSRALLAAALMKYLAAAAN